MYIIMMLHPSQKVLAVYVTIRYQRPLFDFTYQSVPTSPDVLVGVVMNNSESLNFAMLFSVIFKKYEYLSSLTNLFQFMFWRTGSHWYCISKTNVAPLLCLSHLSVSSCLAVTDSDIRRREEALERAYDPSPPQYSTEYGPNPSQVLLQSSILLPSFTFFILQNTLLLTPSSILHLEHLIQTIPSQILQHRHFPLSFLTFAPHLLPCNSSPSPFSITPVLAD